MGAAGVAVFSTDGGFDFSVSTGYSGVHLPIRDLGLSSSGRGRKARMGSGPRRGESARHDRTRRQDCWVNFLIARTFWEPTILSKFFIVGVGKLLSRLLLCAAN